MSNITINLDLDEAEELLSSMSSMFEYVGTAQVDCFLGQFEGDPQVDFLKPLSSLMDSLEERLEKNRTDARRWRDVSPTIEATALMSRSSRRRNGPNEFAFS